MRLKFFPGAPWDIPADAAAIPKALRSCVGAQRVMILIPTQIACFTWNGQITLSRRMSRITFISLFPRARSTGQRCLGLANLWQNSSEAERIYQKAVEEKFSPTEYCTSKGRLSTKDNDLRDVRHAWWVTWSGTTQGSRELNEIFLKLRQITSRNLLMQLPERW